tara:strand:- start:146 stop:496 length:351 start_codon:yes stop_codon:yes gene_type:complete
MALPLRNRLKRGKDFKGMFRAARSAREGKLVVKVKRAAEKGPRFGVVVAKSVEKKAVARNRMRRLLTEAFQEEQKATPQPYDIVVVVQAGAVLNSKQDAREQLKRVLSKALLKQSP